MASTPPSAQRATARVPAVAATASTVANPRSTVSFATIRLAPPGVATMLVVSCLPRPTAWALRTYSLETESTPSTTKPTCATVSAVNPESVVEVSYSAPSWPVSTARMVWELASHARSIGTARASKPASQMPGRVHSFSASARIARLMRVPPRARRTLPPGWDDPP